MDSRGSLVQQLKMKKIFTVCLCLVGLLDNLSAVAFGAPHDSSLSPRKSRQVALSEENASSNIRNHPRRDGYNSQQYFMSYLPSYRPSRHGDNELVAAASVVKSGKNLVAEEISLGKHNGFYDPFYYFSPDLGSSAGANGRIRRNSHGTHMQMPMYGGDSSYENPRERERDTAYLYERERSNMGSNNVFPNHPAPPPPAAARRLYRNPNQFLTKQQITAAQSRFNQAQARYYSPSSNFIENREQNYYNNNNNNNGSPYYRSNRNANLEPDIDNGRQNDDEAWSIQVGTQLKVNDDGRERNPEQFYVRDETRGGNSHSHNRRYSPPYYRS